MYFLFILSHLRKIKKQLRGIQTHNDIYEKCVNTASCEAKIIHDSDVHSGCWGTPHLALDLLADTSKEENHLHRNP
jgi:hypothetical protein